MGKARETVASLHRWHVAYAAAIAVDVAVEAMLMLLHSAG